MLGSLLQRDRPGECAVRAISVQSVVPIGEDRAATEELRPVLLLAHEFAAERPNQKWIADFTCIWTAEGWLHHQYFARITRALSSGDFIVTPDFGSPSHLKYFYDGPKSLHVVDIAVMTPEHGTIASTDIHLRLMLSDN